MSHSRAIVYDDATKTLRSSGKEFLFENVRGVFEETSRSTISRSFTCDADFSLPDVNLNDYTTSAIVHEVGGSGKILKADLYGVVLFDEPLSSTQTSPLISAFGDSAHAYFGLGAAPNTSRTTASALAEFQAHIDNQKTVPVMFSRIGDQCDTKIIAPVLVYDFSDKNTLEDWNNYAAEIGATSTMTHYEDQYDALWIANSGPENTGSLELPLPKGYDKFDITWGSKGWNWDDWGPMLEVTLCLCSSANNFCSSAACTVISTTGSTWDTKKNWAYYTHGQILRIEEDFASVDANIVITFSIWSMQTARPELYARLQPLGLADRVLIYDFTHKNSQATWQAYAQEIGGSSFINSFNEDYGGVGMGGAWVHYHDIGWLNVPLPAGYDTVTIDYGHADVGGEVRLCLCTMPNQMCSHYTCTILATHEARGNFCTRPSTCQDRRCRSRRIMPSSKPTL